MEGEPGQLSAEADAAYGPDDPAYGPPSREWYQRDERAEQQAADDLQYARGPFEPPPRQSGSGQEVTPYLPVGYEPLGAGEASGATKALDHIRHFYLTAEALGPESLDRQFGELLERQRQLITDYFTESGLQDSPR